MMTYPRYKDSKVPWIGDIPSHWEVTRTKNIFRLRTEKSGIDHDLELLSIYTHIGVRPRNSLEQKGNKASTTDNYWIVKKGDLIVNKLLAWMGAVGVSHYSGVTSPAYDILRAVQNINPDYYHYLFRTKLYLQQFKAWSRGIMDMRLRLYFDQFGQIPSMLPPRSEQDQIAKYLDWQTAKINRFIKNKKKLIDLFAERRNAITNEAAKLPETKHLRFGVVATQIVRPVNRENDEIFTPVGLYNRGRGVFHKNPTKGSELGDSTFFWIKKGDLVFSGQFAWEGAVAIAGSDDEGCIASHRYPIFRGKSEIVDSAYLLSFFRTKLGHLVLNYHSRGAAGRNRPLNARTLMKEKIPIPPIDIQNRIIELVNHETALRNDIAREEKLLQELRSRIIGDVVTGKVDVRSVEIPDFEPVEADLEVQDDEESEDELITEGIDE